MDTAFDILQAIGLGLAFGLRPAVAPLVVAVCAAANFTVDFDGTPFGFLESPVVLIVLVVLAVMSVVDAVRAGRGRATFDLGWLLVAVALAALYGAGSVADHDESLWPVGAVVGVVAAILGYFAIVPIVLGVRQRLQGEAEASLMLPAIVELVAALTAFLSLLLPPLAIVALIAVLVLYVRGRRTGGERYAGLRTLSK